MNSYIIAIQYDDVVRYHDFRNSESVCLSANVSAEIFVPKLMDHTITIENINSDLPIIIRSSFKNEVLSLQHAKATSLSIDGLTINFFASLLEDEQEYSFDDLSLIQFGLNGEVEMAKDYAFLEVIDDTYNLVPIIDTFVNGKRIDSPKNLLVGDHIFLGGYNFIVGNHSLITKQRHKPKINLLYVGLYKSKYDEDYPNFRRSPRIIYPLPTDGITIENPPKSPTKPTDKIARLILTPLTSLVTTAIMALIRANTIFIIMGVVTTVITITTSLVNFASKKKQYKKDMIERDKYYENYLKNKAIEINDSVREQQFSLNYHYPNVNTLFDFAKQVDARIYERNRYHFDYLKYRLGVGRAPLSFNIKFDQHEVEMNKDPLIVEASHLKKRFDNLTDMPLSSDLSIGMLGYIGKRSAVIEQIQLMLAQIAFFHSYHDLEFVSIFPELEKDQWEQLKWLPHFTLHNFNMRGFVYHDRSKDQIMSSLNQVLKDRKQALEDKQAEARGFTPHYVIVVADEKLIIDHPIMELLSHDPIDLGATLIQVKDIREDLNENTKTIIDIRNDREGVLVIDNGTLVNRKFVLDHSHFELEEYSRYLSPLNHLLTMSSSIPEKVSFLEMYQVDCVSELGISNRWANNETFKTLAVPLGLRGQDDIVYLNLHEKAHGPHGLVAGTTGSGKSEIVQSYILSLAVNFHPYEVAFLLIDYKGGGMANLFKDMPHHLGSITNLDGSQSMRALISIKAELQRRQRLFSEFEVNHINQYQKLFKSNPRMTPMPHLFLISDEFAELKSEQPEFMKELVSTARIGRSLGIHLILATQKPSGVVDDQIWSNSKFKLCLKVADASDSKEMLKTTDAANITLPGRSYLQVGNNEIYELFQSAYSGSDYHENKDEVVKDNRIYKINDLGQQEVLTQDLSGLTKQKDVKATVSELDAVIEEIARVADCEKVEKLAQPWLPPLESNVVDTEKTKVNYMNSWVKEDVKLNIAFSMKDEPHFQSQSIHYLDLNKDGHLAVFGSPGMGKSVTLQRVVTQSAKMLSPEKLNIYLFDFGTNGLLPLRDFPHVGDIFTIDDKEKISKWVNRIKEEIKDRKRVLSEVGVANVEMYQNLTKNTIPEIVIVMDNYDALRESDFLDLLEPFLIQISRDGSSLGIHLIISASRSASMRYQLSSNIKLQLCLYMNDQTEVNTIVGRSQFSIDEIQGRSMMNIGSPTLMQVLQPVEGADALEMIENIKGLSSEMNENYKGARPSKIPMMPETLTHDYFNSTESVQAIRNTEGLLTFALDYYNVQAYPVAYKENFYYVGPNATVTNDRVMMFVDAMIEKGHLPTVLDMDSKPLITNQVKFKNYLAGGEAVEKCIRDIHALMRNREEQMNNLLIAGDDEGAKQLIESQSQIFIVINNVMKVTEGLPKAVQGMLLELLDTAGKYNISFIVFTDLASTSIYGDVQKYLKQVPEVMLEVKVSDQSFYSVNKRMMNEPVLSQNDAYFIKDGNPIKVKMV